jgi:hypothetical protein
MPAYGSQDGKGYKNYRDYRDYRDYRGTNGRRGYRGAVKYDVVRRLLNCRSIRIAQSLLPPY